jgi:hypothetical protein
MPAPSKCFQRSRPSERYATPVVTTTARARTTAPSASVDLQRVGCGLQRDRLARRDHADAELDRLQARLRGEVVAAHAEREAEVVLDARRRRRLAAGRHAVEQHRAQALGGAVDRGREPGRPGADHGEVDVGVLLGRVGEAHELGDASGRGAQHVWPCTIATRKSSAW